MGVFAYYCSICNSYCGVSTTYIRYFLLTEFVYIVMNDILKDDRDIYTFVKNMYDIVTGEVRYSAKSESESESDESYYHSDEEPYIPGELDMEDMEREFEYEVVMKYKKVQFKVDFSWIYTISFGFGTNFAHCGNSNEG